MVFLNRREIEYAMTRCIEVAERAGRNIRPPYVGAVVITPKKKVVGVGYKKLLSGSSLVVHAEREALDMAGDRAEGSCLITTLEPCVRIGNNHIFKSCSELIVERGIRYVVLGMLDDSPSFPMGKGVGYLKSQGIEVLIHKELKERIKRELIGSYSSDGD